jgi:hypothetical protein
MKLEIANISDEIKAPAFDAAVAAISRQVAEHFQPEWGTAADIIGTVVPLANRKAPIAGDRDAIIYVGDSSQDPATGVENALGYHATNQGNIPYGFIYLDIVAEAGEEWTTTLSHEVLELLADPDATMTVTGPAPRGRGHVHYDLEVCDPTQGDSYQIDNVSVSNFVGRSYFGLKNGNGKSNYLGLLLNPFGVRPKGYFQYEDGNGRTHQIMGEEVTPGQRAAKQKMGKVRRNRRREDRIQ